jgi:ribosomal protein L5
MLTGTKVTLRKEVACNFLTLFISLILPNNKEFKFFNLNNKGCLSIGLKNLFAFPQLNSFYDRFPKDMTGTINITPNIKKKEYSLLFYTGLLIPLR